MISVTIQRGPRDVYNFIARSASVGHWASGLGKSLANGGTLWRFEGENGPVRIRFTALNGYGVLDQYVELPDGSEIYMPMRVISNGSGTELQFTFVPCARDG